MIPNEEEWHYLVVKNLSALLRGLTSKTNGNFYCLNCIHSLTTKKNLGFIKMYVKTKNFCGVAMSSGETEILGFNPNWKSAKTPSVI